MRLRNFPYASNPVVAAALGVLLVLLVVKIFNIAYPISITTKEVSAELAVVGEGKVEAIPDTASVQVGIVVNEAATVAEVENEINTINNDIVAAMTALGIEAEKIKTTNYSINPNYNFIEGRGDEISGYNGSATLTIELDDTTLLPRVITAATEAGANQVYGTNYSIDDPAKYREEARNLAIENAREQAQKLANQLGINLGRVVNIVESGSSGNGPVPYYSLEADTALGGRVAPDLQPGSQTITSTVTLYFERK